MHLVVVVVHPPSAYLFCFVAIPFVPNLNRAVDNSINISIKLAMVSELSFGIGSQYKRTLSFNTYLLKIVKWKDVSNNRLLEINIDAKTCNFSWKNAILFLS